MIEHKVKPRAIELLTNIRQTIMEDDGELSFKVADCGKFVAGDLISDTIAAISRTEQQLHKTENMLRAERDENKEYQNLLGGYQPDDLTEKEKADIAALVVKWDAERGTDE